MAPPPEYDKEPKAPDKCVTNISTDDSKVLYNLISDQQDNSDLKPTNAAVSSDIENNKHVGALDDGQLRALLDEAIAYKRPKDREGKSSLFKELLEEVEQDEQACEAAARSLPSARGGARRPGHGRRALPHSNSLQDLMAAALAAEPPRHRAHAHPPPASVSARAHHGGSLPSGVDTSFMSEEPTRGGYLATVRCVNPPPLAERRVSASDAHAPAELDHINRRSKPMFPMTYTARATLEIGSSSVSSGRAVTTTTPSNQIPRMAIGRRTTTCGTPERMFTKQPLYDPGVKSQARLMDALKLKKSHTGETTCSNSEAKIRESFQFEHDKIGDLQVKDLETVEAENPRDVSNKLLQDNICEYSEKNQHDAARKKSIDRYMNSEIWTNNVDNWYKGLSYYLSPCNLIYNRGVYMDSADNYYTHSSGNDNLHASVATKNTDCSEHNKFMNHFAHIPQRNLQNSSNECVTSDKIKIHKLIKTDCTGPRNPETWKDEHYLDENTKSAKNTTISCQNSSITDADIDSKLMYRKRVKRNFIVPTTSSTNPKNFRSMTIGNNIEENDNYYLAPKPYENESFIETDFPKENSSDMFSTSNFLKSVEKSDSEDDFGTTSSQNDSKLASVLVKSIKDSNFDPFEMKDITTKPQLISSASEDKEMVNFPLSKPMCKSESFSQFVTEQKKLFQKLTVDDNKTDDLSRNTLKTTEFEIKSSGDTNGNADAPSRNIEKHNLNLKHGSHILFEVDNSNIEEDRKLKVGAECIFNVKTEENHILHPQNNTHIALTLPVSFVMSSTNTNIDNTSHSNKLKNKDMKISCKEKIHIVEKTSKRNTEQKLVAQYKDRKKAEISTLSGILFENLFHRPDKYVSGIKVVTYNDKEVDSAIPFSCITTPEVVASCNTTSSTTQSAVAVDPKPLQLDSYYRAVSCLTGEPTPYLAAAGQPPATHAPPATSATHASPASHATPATHALLTHEQPRSVISSSFNGLPLTRPSYGSTATTTTTSDDSKKSLDENGNSVQGFSSPLSGSSQHKKPRRKKSSKNETVIKSQEIDGYQGNKDLNEVLRFIESNADNARGNKIGRTKHKDDSDDKGGKKRSTERRKDKESKMKRATSMEELSRTKLSDLTDKPAARAEPAKPERRSWGADGREPRAAFYLGDAPAAAPADLAAELTDFQTVTKKRKPRRRADEPEPPRRRAPEPRARRESAPPSDRSNDSNDDMDSVHSLHSLPADAAPARLAPPPPPHASYADIARTRHNIPDLIESCNFYVEGEGAGEPRRPEPAAEPAAVAPGDADYPALEARAARRRDKAAPRAPRKERPDAAPPADCPAPDVVADRRPAVILLDCASRPRDMEGVTFGFDINEQLVGAARRPRCDLVRDALEGAVAVAAGGAALRYLPPRARHDARLALQIVDYVATAWEDVVRCGSSKVRYFTE